MDIINTTIMARVQYGAIITDLKGNIGGQTFQNGNVSKVLRNKGYRAGTSSVRRQAANTNITSQASRWKSLTDGERDTWEAAVESWPFTDKYGNAYFGTGYQVFIAYNSALVQLGLSVNTAPGVVTASYDLGGVLTVGWNVISLLTQWIQIFVSPPISPGRNGNNVVYRYMNKADQSDGDEWSDTPNYSSVWGLPPVGSKIMFKLVFRNPLFPRIFQTSIVSLIVTEV
jgi:hypothetical protein